MDGVLFSKDKTRLVYYPMGRDRTTYEIPSGVLSISDSAFNNSIYERYEFRKEMVYGYVRNYNNPLKKVVLPEGLLAVGSFVFLNSNLIELELSKTLNYIGSETFYNGLWASKITLPKSLTFIWGGTFSNTGLSEVFVETTNVEFMGTVSDPLIFDKRVKLFGYLGSTTEDYAEKKGYQFNQISNPPGITVKPIMEKGLESNPYSVEKRTTIYNNKTKTITISDSIIDLCHDISNENNKKAENIIIPNSVKYLHSSFTGLPKLKYVEVPDSVVYIGKGVIPILKNFGRIRILNPHAYIEDGAISHLINAVHVYKFYHEPNEIRLPYIIEGYQDSSAQVYAEVNGIKFVSLGKAKTPELKAVYNVNEIAINGKKVSAESLYH